METYTIIELVEAFEKQFYSLGSQQRQKLINHHDPKAVLGRIAFLIDCQKAGG